MHERSSRTLGLAIVVLLNTLGATGLARDADRAQALFGQASVAYRLGRFVRAIELFKQSLALSDRPSTIVNIAQCYRQLGKRKQALFYYRLYLTRLRRSGDDRYRAEVEGHIARIQAEIAAAKQRRRSAPAPQPPATMPVFAAQSPPPVKATPPFYRRWWFWTATVAVVAGSIAVIAATTGGDARVASDADGRFGPGDDNF